MTKLSEATWAVIAAYGDAPFSGRPAIAAALRAAAENFLMDWDAIQCCDFLLDMADELEAQ
jgi:hypothetical protein